MSWRETVHGNGARFKYRRRVYPAPTQTAAETHSKESSRSAAEEQKKAASPAIIDTAPAATWRVVFCFGPPSSHVDFSTGRSEPATFSFSAYGNPALGRDAQSHISHDSLVTLLTSAPPNCLPCLSYLSGALPAVVPSSLNEPSFTLRLDFAHLKFGVIWRRQQSQDI
ncbi:hypothetical protein C8R44DRAFT_976445 [Mycena epipterygia]|nr:hypothetical protein C8R44DRAFT_976445 [Mycena epipterygia]